MEWDVCSQDINYNLFVISVQNSVSFVVKNTETTECTKKIQHKEHKLCSGDIHVPNRKGEFGKKAF